MDGCMDTDTSKQISNYMEHKQASKQANNQTHDPTCCFTSEKQVYVRLLYTYLSTCFFS